MIAAPPAPKAKRRKAQEGPAGALRRVYADGRYHWALQPASTLCGLPYSRDDVAKPGDIQCATCTEIAGIISNQEQPR